MIFGVGSSIEAKSMSISSYWLVFYQCFDFLEDSLQSDLRVSQMFR